MLVLQHDMDDLLRELAKAEELRNLGIVEEADLEEVDEDFLRDPECTINLVTKRRLRKMKAAWDARKIERELGWRPAETFDTGIKKTVQWYLDNPIWVEGVVSGSYRDWLQKQYS